MNPRMNLQTANPEVFEAMLKVEACISQSGLDEKLYKLLKVHASKLNDCDFCSDMHTQGLRQLGETEERIHSSGTWSDAPYYTEVEKVVLELTEAVTFISKGGVPEPLYNKVRLHFDEKQYMTLIMAINAINCWNRLAVATGTHAGCLI